VTRVRLPRSIPIVRYVELDSTNAEARRRAEAREEGPVWLTALRQTAGRGRRGRAWETGAGNLAATLLVTWDLEPSEAGMTAFLAALCVHDCVAGWVAPERVRLKWPNDVLLDGRKVAGILIESGRTSDGRLWLAIGVGVNLKTPPQTPERPAAALAQHLDPATAPPSPDEALVELSRCFSAWTDVWAEEGSGAVLAAWSGRATGLGMPCLVRLEGETLDGVAEGLDADGALRLRLRDGVIRRITAGDVFFPHLPGPGSA